MIGIIALNLILLSAQNAPFITTWKTNNPGISDSTSITIPTDTFYEYNYEVDWNNDGKFDTTGIKGDFTYDFGRSDTFTIRIRGDFPTIAFYDSGDKEKILSIDQWGDIKWKSFSDAFSGAINLILTATDVPDLSMVEYLDGMFSGATKFNGDINTWDVSNIVYMNGMFSDAFSFNQYIGDWDVSNVIYMTNMFSGATSFNQDIGGWDVSNVFGMNGMFSYAFSFNQDIGDWDVSEVSEMRNMFAGHKEYTSYFNQDIGDWDVSKVEDMSGMFEYATSFDQDIGNWDVSGVEDMSGMFSDAVAFNQDIGDWDVSKVEDMSVMFEYATSFDQDIGNWDVSNVEDMRGMFELATSFDQNISDWNVAKVKYMSGMFLGAMSFNGDIGSWNVSGVTEMWSMFSGATSFDQNIGGWEVTNVTKMWSMFSGATSFNQDIGTWDVSNVEEMTSMFSGATSFNQDIGTWDVSNVEEMTSMFFNATQFNQNLGQWNIVDANIKDMLNKSGLSTKNYDQTLFSWDSLGFVGKNLGLVEGLTYCDSEEARFNLIDHGWTINGDALKCENICKIVADAGNDTTFCFDDDVVAICAVEQDGVIYSWRSGSNALEGKCVDLVEGQWVLSITDSLGCSDIDTINISQSTSIEVNLSEDSTVNISGGTAPYDTAFSQGDGSMKVMVTDVNGCTGQDSLITTSTHHARLTYVNIFPNPVHDILTIKTKGYDSYEVNLCDQFGRKLIQRKNAIEIDVSQFDPGIYYLQVFSRELGVRIRHLPVVIVR